ncbi:hypothetical protein THOM_1543 [Trachipleistophora hominis]|uniref:Protein yippee-like n=1 Tax=Trachipleistophora hominis TaxID=72359 RepID=L7JVJ1_TRAHO|nr:hypothetical protein THOM_1543 [Trachipleistophora hominis]
MESDDALQYPFILQCAHCKTIIADSFSLIDYVQNTLTLTKVSSFVKFKEKECPNERPYAFILCECDTVVGKKYRDESVYLLDDTQLISYVLGNGNSKRYSINEVVEELGKLQKFCLYLYNRLDHK